MVNENNLKPICESIILPVNDPLIIIDHLERSVSYLSMPGARIQAWLSCMGLRSCIMWHEHKKDKGQWAYKNGSKH